MNLEKRSMLNLMHFYKKELEKLPCEIEKLELTRGSIRKLRENRIITYNRGTGAKYYFTSKGRQYMKEVQGWR